jgi:DNA-binding transcriptional ArsR family regulator
MNMDRYVSVAEAALRIGVPPGRVLACVRARRVSATKDTRGRWRLPAETVAALSARWGAVPHRVDGLDRESMLVLAALTRRPRGLASVRAVAAATGLAPTTVSRRLKVLTGRGLIEARDEPRILRGAAVSTPVWQVCWRASGWEARLPALAEVVLPARDLPPPAWSLPDHVWHLVWNGDPRKVALPDDAAFIAGRVLEAADPEAEAWALRALPAEAWARAAQDRGRSPRQRAIARQMAASARA